MLKMPCSAVRIFTSSFSSVLYSSLPCSCSFLASNLAFFSPTMECSASRRDPYDTLSRSSLRLNSSASTLSFSRSEKVSISPDMVLVFSSSPTSSVLIFSSSVLIFSSSDCRMSRSCCSRSDVIAAFCTCTFLYSSSSCISLNRRWLGMLPCSCRWRLTRSSIWTMLACRIAQSFSTPARFGSKFSMNSVNSLSCCSSLSYLSAASSPPCCSLRSVRTPCSLLSCLRIACCSSWICASARAMSELSRRICSLSCARCSSGDICSFLSSSSSSYRRAVSVDSFSCSASARCLI
mmetsp:Transcript_663/g.1526  ORF Transcript_663/g.1526 Transcript_663/m.1526 type:complete len:292 (-) Transcript_663:786-1661(-)